MLKSTSCCWFLLEIVITTELLKKCPIYSDSQAVLGSSLNKKFYNWFHKSPPLIPFLSKMNPMHVFHAILLRRTRNFYDTKVSNYFSGIFLVLMGGNIYIYIYIYTYWFIRILYDQIKCITFHGCRPYHAFLISELVTCPTDKELTKHDAISHTRARARAHAHTEYRVSKTGLPKRRLKENYRCVLFSICFEL
jgi:hypothetical protein